MPLVGGASDKFGNRYEALWTVSQLIRLLDERAEVLRLEAPGSEGEGCEFWIQAAEVREYHQVKRQISANEKWTLAQLQQHGVLPQFWQHLHEPMSQCVFISMDDASQLRELAERARGAANCQEFEQHYMTSPTYQNGFNNLMRYWGNCSPKDAFTALRRIDVHLVGEQVLLYHVEAELAQRFEADPATVRAVMADFLLVHIHHHITAHILLQHLATHNILPWVITPHHPLARAVAESTERYIESHRIEQIQPRLRRDETSTLLSHLLADEGTRRIMVTGSAGVGKSGVSLACIEAVLALGWPVLSLRVDHLPDVATPQSIGMALFQRHLSPVHILAQIAQKMPCLLVIDQLDAISLASGRRTELFDVIREIIEQAQYYPWMRVLLVVRAFDLAHDYRLRALLNEERAGLPLAVHVPVALLSEEMVTACLNRWGIATSVLTEPQRNLLRTPLHLKLFRDIIADFSRAAPSFTTVNDLYRLFIQRKEQDARHKAGRGIAFWPTIDTLTTYMSRQQRLTAPESLLDAYQADAQALTSAHLLIHDDTQRHYAFFHEGFFDYAFARRFALAGQALLELLLSDEQHLFRRAQVRQILALERETAPAAYMTDLRGLLQHPAIRFHLRQIALAFLGTLADPQLAEWELLAPFAEDTQHELQRECLTMLAQSIAWFDLLDHRGVWQDWLTQSDLVEPTFAILRAHQPQRAERVAVLLAPYLSTRLAPLSLFVRYADVGGSRAFFDLFLSIIDAGGFDQPAERGTYGNDVWLLLHTLPAKEPQWACEAISRFLRRRQSLCALEGVLNPLTDMASSHGVLAAAATGAPQTFVESLLPLVLSLSMANRSSRAETLPHDTTWPYFTLRPTFGFAEELLDALVLALAAVAQDVTSFASIADQLMVTSSATTHYLLIRTYTSQPALYADMAVIYMHRVPAILTLSYMERACGVAFELIRALSPHCSDEALMTLEQTILDAGPMLAGAHSQRGMSYSQWQLLTAIIPQRRSPRVKRKIATGRRRFNQQEPTAPVRHAWQFGDSVVRSPIPDATAEHLTDQQWRAAFERYADDALRWDETDRPVGGASQLARVLEGVAKQHPQRFARLALTLPDETHHWYFDAILRGVSATPMALADLKALIAHCHALPERPCGTEICRTIGSFAERPLAAALIETVAWYAEHDPDPMTDVWRTAPDGMTPYYGGSIDTAAINATRGTAAEVISKLLSADPERLLQLLPTITALTVDRVSSVRAATLHPVRVLATLDRDLAVDYLIRMCTDNDDLLHSHFFALLLRPLLFTHFAALVPLLDRMLAAEQEEIVTAGAMIAAYVGLVLPDMAVRVRACLHGTVPQRLGVAKIYAANLLTHGSQFLQDFVAFFADPDDTIREEAVAGFHDVHGDDLAQIEPFVAAFVASPALLTHPFHFLYALENSTAKLSDVICQACERLLPQVEQTADGRAREQYAAIADMLVTLVLRDYTQSMTAAVQARCLDLLDRIARQGYPRLDKPLELFDR